MTNDEMLLAISDLLDVKLKAQLQPLRNEFHDEIHGLRDEMHAENRSLRDELHTEIQAVKRELHLEIQAIRDDLRVEIQGVRDELHAEIQDLRDELHAEIQGVRDELRAEIQDLRDELRNELHDEIQSLDARIRRLELNQENIIIPRLNNIEFCYTDTFKRYRDYADKMDSTYEDVELLKKVVMEHSEKLQKLA